MLELGLAVIFVKAFMLCGLLYVFGRHEADYNFQKVAMLNGRPVKAGDYVSTTHQGKRYEWRVRGVSKRARELEPIRPDGDP